MNNSSAILIIDDSRTFRKEAIRILTERKVSEEFIEANDGLEALHILFTQKIDLIISDWLMPKIDGIMLLQSIRSHPDLFDIPLILTTSKGEISEKLIALQEGATDYITKPFLPDELAIRAINLLKIKHFQETLKEKNKELEKLSMVDTLTGIYNRNYLAYALKREWKRSIRFKSQLSCLMMDLDSFKKINDTLGHKCGDEILKEVAKVISSMVRGYDFCCRYGGDEFIIILSHNSKDGTKIISDRLREKIYLHRFLEKTKLNIHLTISIGGVAVPGDQLKDPEEIIDMADQALYIAKNAGKNCVKIN